MAGNCGETEAISKIEFSSSFSLLVSFANPRLFKYEISPLSAIKVEPLNFPFECKDVIKLSIFCMSFCPKLNCTKRSNVIICIG